VTTALTHRSYINEHPADAIEDNERLEFLGDAVLGFVTTVILYNRYPEMPEGQMTRLRAALVRTETLSRLAREKRNTAVAPGGRTYATRWKRSSAPSISTRGL
jgi:ribonuclease-3